MKNLTNIEDKLDQLTDIIQAINTSNKVIGHDVHEMRVESAANAAELIVLKTDIKKLKLLNTKNRNESKSKENLTLAGIAITTLVISITLIYFIGK